MTAKQYILYRNGLRKRAFDIPIVGPLAKNVVDAGGSAATALSKESLAIAAISMPALAAITAYMMAKATSPAGAAKNADEYAVNALEKESLAQSIRDLEDLKLKKQLAAKSGKVKRHDRFI